MEHWLLLSIKDVIRLFCLTVWSKPSITLLFNLTEFEIPEEFDEDIAKGT
jgi:hypothetical protein